MGSLPSRLPNYLVAPLSAASLIQGVVKEADETRVSTTTLTDDAELTLPVEANSFYGFRFFVEVTSPSAADWNFKVVGPSGATVRYGYISGATAIIGNVTEVSVGLPTNGGTNLVLIEGSIITGGTAGSLTLQWSQVTSQTGDTTVHDGSWMQLIKNA